MKRIFLCLSFLFAFYFAGFAQSDTAFKVKLETEHKSYRVRPSIDIDRYWKFKKGDDAKWAARDLNDKDWSPIDTRLPVEKSKPGPFEGIGWFRVHLQVDTALLNKTLALMMTQQGASEIYLDGKLINTLGDVQAKDLSKEERFDPLYLPYDIRFDDTATHVLAIRYSNLKAVADKEEGNIGFSVKIGYFARNVTWHYINSTIVAVIFTFYFTFFFALAFLHLTLFLYYRANRSNLYFCIFAFTFGTTFLCLLIQQTYLDPGTAGKFDTIQTYLSNFYEPALLAMLYSIFLKRIPKYYWIWVGAFFIDLVCGLLDLDIPYFGITLTLAFVVESFRMIISSIIKKREGAWIIGVGIISTILFFAAYVVLALTGNAQAINTQEGIMGLLVLLFVVYATLSIPASMAVFLAREFAKTSKNLQKKLVEVEDLSAKSIEQEKEKQQILANQNETLERQVKERTAELEEKNKEILDSIRYASRIQKSLLPNEKYITRVLNILQGKD